MNTADMIEKLEDVIEVLANYADIDGDGGPNAEDRAIGRLQDVIDALRRRKV